MRTTIETFPEPPDAVAVTRIKDRTAPLFARVEVDLPCVLIDLTYGNVIRGRVANLSVGGMRFRGADSLALGSRVLCALVRGAGAWNEELYASGTVVYRRGGAVGIAFDEVTPRAFIAIGEMIAAGGGLRLKTIEPHPVTPIRRRPRPRRARLGAWRQAHPRAA